MLGDASAVFVDLGGPRIAAAGHVVQFFKQRQIVVGGHVAGGARVAVPVPGAADIGSALDDADALDTVFAQAGDGQQRGKTAAGEQHLDGVVEGFARLEVAAVWVVAEMGQVAVQIGGVLGGALGPVIQAQVALLGELPLDFVVVRLWLVTLVVGVEGAEAGDVLALGYFAHCFGFCHGNNLDG